MYVFTDPLHHGQGIVKYNLGQIRHGFLFCKIKSLQASLPKIIIGQKVIFLDLRLFFFCSKKIFFLV